MFVSVKYVFDNQVWYGQQRCTHVRLLSALPQYAILRLSLVLLVLQIHLSN